jgi:diaminopimelate decarboxylase
VTTAKHAVHAYFRRSDGELHIGGMAIAALAQRVGRTPFYVYGRAAIVKRIGELRAMLPKSVKLHYAVKANPMPALVDFIAPRVDGLDVASVGEMAVALDTGIDATQVSFAGPGKSPDDLARAVAAGIVLSVESEREVQRLVDIAKRTATRPRLTVRVNPDFELKTSGMKMSGGSKQFGVDAERVPQLLHEISLQPLDFVGFHIFSGSQNLSADAIVEAQQKSVELAIELARSAPAPVRILNIGGGFGIPYFPGEKPLEIAPIAAGLNHLASVVSTHLPNAELVIELGRYIVGEAGLYVCRVLDRKVSRGLVFLVTDGGLHHHLAASGNFGQVIRKNYPVMLAGAARGARTEIVSVVGPLCTPLDLLADRVELEPADVGDLIVVLQSGAYGLTASPTRFLNHPPPAEVLI